MGGDVRAVGAGRANLERSKEHTWTIADSSIGGERVALEGLQGRLVEK